MLAYHWRSALELARAAGQDEDELRDARGSRCARPVTVPSRSMRSGAAVAYYAEALALWPAEAPGRASSCSG